MTKIGVLSDTHLQEIRQGVQFLSGIYQRYFSDVSVILHAGDMVSADIMMAFEGIPVYAVRGNMDPYVPGVPVKRIVEVAGARIGLIHGWGPPDGLEQRVLREFSGQNIDALVYGHSHAPACHHKNGVLLFNPGSPIDRRLAAYCSVGILEVGDGVKGHIIPLDSVPPPGDTQEEK